METTRTVQNLKSDENDENDDNERKKLKMNLEKVPMDMDDLLAQINVVTCDMDESGPAKPLKELLRFENNNKKTDNVNQETTPTKNYQSLLVWLVAETGRMLTIPRFLNTWRN